MCSDIKTILIMISFVSILTSLFGQKNVVVGSIDGSIDVTSSGSATYTIPIQVVPGTANIQPNLAIFYNSQSNAGILGMRWHLSGLSSINRVPQNAYLDNNITGINLDNNDRYALDGNRLIAINVGGYGNDGTLYATEIETFTRIKSFGNIQGSPQSFEAQTDDGKIIEYGTTTDSRQMLGNNVLSWLIHKITDSEGNFMIYTYEQSNGEIWVKEISYTGNASAGLLPYAKVTFEYESENLHNTIFIAGESLVQSKLLTGIKVHYNNSIVRQYNFVYHKDKMVRLTKISLTGSDGSMLKDTEIDWGDATQELTYNYHNQQFNDKQMLIGNFDDDGINDIFYYKAIENNKKYSYVVYKNGGVNNFSTIIAQGEMSYKPLYVVDTDGDGIDEIVYCDAEHNGFVIFHKMHFELGHPVTSTISSVDNLISSYYGDFNGDGKCDFLFVKREFSLSLPFQIKTIGTFWNMGSVGNIQFAKDKIDVIDYNGNGKSDIVVYNDINSDVYEYDNIGNSFIKIVSGAGFPNEYHQCFYGDFNGDGKPDILFANNTVRKWYLNIATGKGYTMPHQEMPLNCELDNHKKVTYPPMIADINGDGKDDIIQTVFNFSTQKLTINVYYSKGFINGVYEYIKKSFINDDIHHFNTYGATFYVFGDLNGDGKIDMTYTGPIYSRNITMYFYENEKYGLVREITNGFNNKIKIKYENLFSPSIKYGGLYARKMLLPITAEIFQSNGIGNNFINTKYYYIYPDFDSKRKQFLGFAYFEQNTNGISTIHKYIKENTFRQLMPEQVLTIKKNTPSRSGLYLNEIELEDPNGDELPFYYYETSTLGTCLNLGDKRFLPYNRITSVTNQLNNSHIRTTLALDNTGKVKSRVVENLNNKANKLLSKTTSQYNYNLITLPNGRQATKIISLKETELLPKSTCTHQQTINYTYENGRLKSETNSSTSITKTINSYNAFGFPISTSISAPNEVTITEQKTYDNTGRFVISSANAMNQVATATYDGKTGNILTATDINGLTTNYTYDAWGNNTSIIYPDNIRENTEISWFSNANFPNAIYYIKKTGTSLPTSIVYFDKLNRKTHSYTEGTGYVQNKYNEKGLLIKTSLPYLNSGDGEQSKIWHEYTYDIYDRVINEKAPYIDISTQYPTFPYASSQNIVKTTDNLRNITYSKTCDMPGRVVSSTDMGGTITYTYSYYYKNGKTLLKQDVESNGSVTSIISDMQGNRLSITEPNSGVTTTNYNKYNQVLTQTDANGNTTSYSYDILGRITQKSITGNGENNVINYYYDKANGKGNGQIHYTKLNGAGDEIFYYDDLGRLSSKNKFINGTVYKDKYTYNAIGQIETFTYPDNFSLKYSYNKFGELYEIKRGDNNDLIYRIDTRNKYRLQEQCVFGNNTGVKYRYNQFGLLTGISSGIISSSNTNKIDFESSGELPGNGYIVTNNYRQLNYSYDNKGFIIRKEDTRSGQYENYTYDKLDRLTSFTVGTMTPYTSATHTRTFNDNGNISTNSQIGSYLYNSSRPHAVDNIRPNSVCTIPQTQNDVTYDNYNRVKTIYEDGKQLSFSYGADQQCNKSVYSVLNPSNGTFITQKTKIYVSSQYEVETTSTGTQKIHYIYSDHGIVAIYVTDNTQSKMYYVHTDHLGSYNLIMDSGKNVVQSCHFDPWGNRKLYNNWATDNTATTFLFDRGYTGHQHHDMFNIINMRARLYDPMIGRFFSPDPYVQAPDNTQNYNRYSYCMNNPVMFTDPSGEFILEAIILGAFFNTASQLISGKINSVGDFFLSAGIGALSGAAGGFAGQAVAGAITFGGFAGGATIGAAGGAAGGFISGAGNAWANGANFGDGLIAGLMGGGIGALTGGLVGGFARGISDYRNGYSFWDGSKVDEFVVGFAQYERIANGYNSSGQADINDEILQMRMQDEFGVGKGDFNIQNITTRTGKGYGMTNSGRYVNLESGDLVGGYVKHFTTGYSNFHISPYYSNGDAIAFRAVAGHELIHAYHYYALPNVNKVYTERVAYKYTYDIYMSNGRFTSALSTMQSAVFNSSGHFFWGPYPALYKIPSPYRFY